MCEARNHGINIMCLYLVICSSSFLTIAVSDGSHLMQLAANLFGYAGEQGEHNALYTYAQLLRIGKNYYSSFSQISMVSMYKVLCSKL